MGTTRSLPVLDSECSVAAVRVLSPLSPLCWPERLRALPFADSREAVVGAGALVLKETAAGTKVAAAAVTMAAAAAAATAAPASAKVEGGGVPAPTGIDEDHAAAPLGDLLDCDARRRLHWRFAEG